MQRKLLFDVKNRLPDVVLLFLCYLYHPIIFKFSNEKVHLIVSIVSTIAGILLGFLIASLSILYASKEDRFMYNLSVIGILPKLIAALYSTTIMLLTTCFIYLLILFIPDNISFNFYNKEYSLLHALFLIGVFFMVRSFIKFYIFLYRFKGLFN